MEGTIFLAQYLSGREHALTGTLCCTIKGRGAAYRHKRVPVQLSSLAANINMAREPVSSPAIFTKQLSAKKVHLSKTGTRVLLCSYSLGFSSTFFLRGARGFLTGASAGVSIGAASTTALGLRPRFFAGASAGTSSFTFLARPVPFQREAFRPRYPSGRRCTPRPCSYTRLMVWCISSAAGSSAPPAATPSRRSIRAWATAGDGTGAS